MLLLRKAVEVNALADELAHAGAGADAIPNSRKNLDVDQTNRLASLQQQTETALYRRSSLSGSQKRPSFSERRISLSLAHQCFNKGNWVSFESIVC